MKFQPYTLVICITSVVLAFFLSSCADNTNVGLFPVAPEQAVSDTAISDPDDSDLELEEIELFRCLDEELIALKQTGLWTDESALVSTQLPDSEANDFPVVMNKQVDMYLKLFQNRQKREFTRWLAKAGTYREIMEKELVEAGLPKDLVYLAMIESGFNQRARSRSKAIGLWQFMKGTGKQYNLKIDRYVDERRDALKSTKAAAAYLADLYKEFGDWHLAVAAYNGGPGKVRYGLKKYKVDNFWDLASKKYLRLETKRYVPKLIAALLIAREPAKYGFTNIPYRKPLRYDTISVGPGMSLDAIALISNSSTREIKTLNHELKQGKTPPNKARYQVNIPEATGQLAKKNISRLHSIASTGYKTHKIRKGDTLSKICKRYDVNKTTLLKVNNLRSGNLASGQNLRIPYSTITYQLLPEGSTDAMAAYKDSLVLHRIRSGETISKIATRYNVSPQMIVAWNGLKNVHTIRAGQQLSLFIDRGGKKPARKSAVQTAQNQAGNLMVLKPTKRKTHIAQAGTAYQYYRVKNGDSLWTISRKFRTSTADIKKWNNMKSNLIHPGSKLKLKKV
jgi:membrane-bound lytic murein transglycosylase D